MSYEGAVYRLRGFFSGMNWRPTRLAEDVSHYLTCRLCKVLPRRTVVLPCQHTLCESCHGSILRDQGGVCPFDGEAFEKEDCGWNVIPAKKIEKLKAHCWNEVHGCNFVGTLQAMLLHYEEGCRFHDVSCPQCSKNMINGELPSHYTAGCSHLEPIGEADQLSVKESLGDVTTVPETKIAPLKDRYEEEVPILETRINELTEQAREHEMMLQQVTTALGGTLEALNVQLTQALGNFSAIFSEALQMRQQASSCLDPGPSSAKKARLSTEAEAGEAAVPLRLETMHILRNLERMVSGVVGYLEDMRHCSLLRTKCKVRAITFASLRIERMPNRCFHFRPSKDTPNKQLHYLLTVLKARELRERSLSTVFTVCDGRNSSFAVHVGEAGASGRRLEVVFISDSPSETFPMLKVVSVKTKMPYSSNVQCLSQENEDSLGSASAGRRQVFYAEFEGCWLDYVRDENVCFEIEMRH